MTHINGTVTEAPKNENKRESPPIDGVAVELSLGKRRLAALHSDKGGGFEFELKGVGPDEELSWVARKDGYKSQEGTLKIGGADSELNISLVPIETETKVSETPKAKETKKKAFPKKILIIAGVVGCALLAIVVHNIWPEKNGGTDGKVTALDRAIAAVRNPYDHEWACDIEVKSREGQTLAAGVLTFGKVTDAPKMEYGKLALKSNRTRRLENQINFNSAAWSLGFFGECLEGECMGFVGAPPYNPMVLVNKVIYDDAKGKLDITGGVMTQRASEKSDTLGLLSGVCRPK